jgi:glycosyltransferase involved in cell wall biosynthesis
MLAQAAVAVFPSVRAQSGDQDGLPVALLEAMAAGTPIVASALPGLSDAVTGTSALAGAAADGPAGVLVEPGDATVLTAAMTRLLADDDLRAAMGRAAVQRASAYSMDAIGARYVELLRDATEAAAGSRR